MFNFPASVHPIYGSATKKQYVVGGTLCCLARTFGCSNLQEILYCCLWKLPKHPKCWNLGALESFCGGRIGCIEVEVGNQDVHLFTNIVVPEESGVTPSITMCLVVTHPLLPPQMGFFVLW